MGRLNDLSPWQLIGVVSTGTCKLAFPTIFTRVTKYDQWIRDNMV